jgi:NO-binding membrane sensor protein with MHYT domain
MDGYQGARGGHGAVTGAPCHVTASGCDAPMGGAALATIHAFSGGPINPALAYAMACLGAFLGFRCMTRARALTGFSRANWLILAAVAIGAAGNWTMHFIAMLGVKITGQQILYNVPLTIGSMLVAIVLVGIGLFTWHGSRGGVRLVIGGVIAGIGIACMHYMGEAAMVMPDSVHYNSVLVAVSVVIALIAGVASLWAGTRVRGIGGTVVASLLIGVAITGMHYIAMEAMEMTPGPMPAMSGSTGASLLFPLVLGISLVTFILALMITLSPTEDEINADAILKRRIQAGPRVDTRTTAPGSLFDPAVPQPAAPHPTTRQPTTRQPATRPQATAAPSHAAPAKVRLSLPDLGGPSRAAALRLKSRVQAPRQADPGDQS